MQQASNGVAGPAVLMFIAAAGVAWMVYSTLFNQGVLTFVILLAYIPAIGISAAVLYRKLKHKH